MTQNKAAWLTSIEWWQSVQRDLMADELDARTARKCALAFLAACYRRRA